MPIKTIRNSIIITSCLLCLPLLTLAANSTKKADNVQNQLDELQGQIKDRQTDYNDYQNKINIYKENLKSKQQEELTLNSQLEVIDQDIALNETEIDQTETEIETLDLQIDAIELKINRTQDDITTKQQQLGGLLLDLYNFDQQTYLEIALTHNTLAEFTEQVEYTNKLNVQLSGALTELKELKDQLKLQQNDLTDKQQDAVVKKQDLQLRQTNLAGEKDYKNNLLVEVQDDEVKFQQLVSQIKAEQDSVNSEILDLEHSARTTLDKLNSLRNTNTPSDSASFIDLPNSFNPDWPIRGTITTYFHDPNYVFRRYFEHNAIDIAASQGSPLKAADSGVVVVVRYDGTSNFAFVTIQHADNFATLYGHVSAVYVETGQVVQKGQVIAAVGGLPGTPGAGAYTTGSHVHFQVLLNGVPVDPLLYLP